MLTIDCRMINSAGIGTYLKYLLPALQAEKRFTLTLLYHEKDKETIHRVAPGANTIPMHSPIYSLKEQFELVYKIPTSTLFWSPHFNVPLLPIRAKKRVVTIHDVFHLAHPLPLKQKAYAHLLYSAASFLSDCVVTISQFSAQEIVKYIRVKPKHLITIPNGIPLERFLPPSVEKRAALQKKYQLPSKFILALGNVKPNKNLPALIEAFKRLSCEEELVIVGKQKGFITPDSGIERGKKIRFVEDVADEEIPIFYHLASLFVFPSLYEGFGYPPLEAMASNCPVIASKKASLPEVCGDGVYYVDPTNISAIQEGIKKILGSSFERAALIEKGKIHVKRFDINAHLQEYKKLIMSFF